MLLIVPASSAAQQQASNVWEQRELERQRTERPLTLAILDFGDSALARLASDKLATNLKHETGVVVLDRYQVRAAARGAGYAGSISQSLSEARDLGAALGCDFFILGDTQTLRRSP